MAITIRSRANAELTKIDIRAEYNSPAESIAADNSVKRYVSDTLKIHSDNVMLHTLDTGRNSAGKLFATYRADLL